MGYTHYWSHGEIGTDAWNQLLHDVQSIIDAAEVPIGDGLGKGTPILTLHHSRGAGC